MLVRDLQRQLRLAGPRSGAFVWDVDGADAVFDLRAGLPRPPASVEKIYTTVALLARLGPQARLETLVRGRGRLRDGIWHGDLYLQGGGDPSFATPAFAARWQDGRGASATALARQLAAAGIRSVTGRLYGDGSLFDARPGGPASGYLPDIADIGGELGGLTFDHGASSRYGTEVFAALAFAAQLRRLGVHVRAATTPAPAPVSARTLAGVASPPLSVLIGFMDRHSDDFYAEQLVKVLGARLGGAGTTAAGAAVVAQVLAAYGLHPRIADGSGLSRGDATTPRQVVDLLAALASTATGPLLEAALPVAGVSGTLAARMRGTAAAGRCRGKTGTLASVSDLAGYCRARGGHLLAFAFFIEGVPQPLAHRIQDAMATTLARDDPQRA